MAVKSRNRPNRRNGEAKRAPQRQGPLQSIEAALALPDLSKSGKIVLIRLILHADSDGTEVFPSDTTVAIRTGVRRETVVRLRRHLRDLGYLDWRSGSAHGRVNHYTINLDLIRQVGYSVIYGCDLSSHPLCDDDTPPVSGNHTSCDLPSHIPTQVTTQGPIQKEGSLGSSPVPPKRLIDFKCRKSKADDSLTIWWLSEELVTELQMEYPSTDVLGVAIELRSKLRSGAQPRYTVRGMKRAIATWVGNAHKWGQHVRTAPKPQVGECEGENQGPWYPEVKYWSEPWHPDDEEYEEHPEYKKWVEESQRKYGDDQQWQRFKTWLEEIASGS